jgi:hypothetical protein
VLYRFHLLPSWLHGLVCKMQKNKQKDNQTLFYRSKPDDLRYARPAVGYSTKAWYMQSSSTCHHRNVALKSRPCRHHGGSTRLSAFVVHSLNQRFVTLSQSRQVAHRSTGPLLGWSHKATVRKSTVMTPDLHIRRGLTPDCKSHGSVFGCTRPALYSRRLIPG